ncbi:hypothetical protein BD410DRAFT_763097 [Rickenella mellea]|uniref:Uncharacterized protein n=1 Tax=Rickenella mellea TaxID=50990 RepID=A0A4Y7QJ99_9AGAM|nr:hypothetical protein BD410DRAFT_763097 [Rickenella mellea]
MTKDPTWREAIQSFQAEARSFNAASAAEDPVRIMIAGELTLASLRKLANIQPDQALKQRWTERGDTFARASGEQRKVFLNAVLSAEGLSGESSGGDAAAEEEPPAYERHDEAAWQEALRDLQAKLDAYDELKRSPNPDASSIHEAEECVVAAMRRLAEIHPDPKVKKQWTERAHAFANADDDHKLDVLKDIGKGVAILLATPFMLAGGVVFAAGAIVYGVGQIVVGLGNLLTFGQVGKLTGKSRKR